jgi:hypothetical protein
MFLKLTISTQSQRKGQKVKHRNKQSEPSQNEKIANADEVARRAYEFYGRGGELGHECDDWMQAERETDKQGRSVQND